MTLHDKDLTELLPYCLYNADWISEL